MEPKIKTIGWKSLVLAGLLSGCAIVPDRPTRMPTNGENAVPERTLYIQATEFDTRRKTSQNPFPQDTVDAFPEYFGTGSDPSQRRGAPGYYLFMTGEDEWRVGSYMFAPQEAIVYEGERITLEILGVRGSAHHTMLVGPDGERLQDADGNDIEFTVKRGELYTVEFTADQRGLYQLICCTHQPTMTMNIHVFPR